MALQPLFIRGWKQLSAYATINKVCFMSDYSQYADIPNSLTDYLKKVKQGI